MVSSMRRYISSLVGNKIRIVDIGEWSGASSLICAEFAFLRNHQRGSDGGVLRAVYIAPVEAVAKERFNEWVKKVGRGLTAHQYLYSKSSFHSLSPLCTRALSLSQKRDRTFLSLGYDLLASSGGAMAAAKFCGRWRCKRAGGNQIASSIVVKVPNGKSNDERNIGKDLTGKEFMEYLEEKEYLLGRRETEKFHNTTVTLSAAAHGLPNSGVPMSLIQRWKSCSRCDCEGWDVGCKIQILTNEDQSGQLPEPSVSSSVRDLFSLFNQEPNFEDFSTIMLLLY